MRNREQEVILDELKFYPTVSVINKEANGGKHKFVEVRLPNGASHKLQWSTTANDGNYRRILNVRLMVRKRMRTLCIDRVIPIKARPIANDVVDRLPRNPVRVPPPIAVEQPSILASQPKPQEITMSTEGTKFVKMTRAQVITAGRLLDEHSIEADGKRSYKPDWNDERIAQIVSATSEPKLNITHIGTLRREVYPDWRIATSPKGPTATQDARIAALEARVQALEDAATAPKASAQPYGQQSAGSWSNGNGQQGRI